MLIECMNELKKLRLRNLCTYESRFDVELWDVNMLLVKISVSVKWNTFDGNIDLNLLIGNVFQVGLSF